MAGGLAGKGSSDRRQGRHVTIAEPVHERHQINSEVRNDLESNDEANWAHLLVPVFGVAAAASIALYTRYVNDPKRSAKTARNVNNKAVRTSKKTVDMSFAARNGTLIKSRSAFV